MQYRQTVIAADIDSREDRFLVSLGLQSGEECRRIRFWRRAYRPAFHAEHHLSELVASRWMFQNELMLRAYS